MIDGDFGNANCHTLLGITRVEKSLEEYLRRETGISDVTVPTAYHNVSLVCGASNKVDELLQSGDNKERLFNDIRSLECKFVILDLGAGINDNTLDLYNLSEEKIVVVTPQFTSLQNAYSFIKSAFLHEIKNNSQLADCNLASMGDVDKITAFFKSLSSSSPEKQEYESCVRKHRFKIIGNLVNKAEDLKIVERLCEIVKEYLDIDSSVLGISGHSDGIQSSINKFTPAVVLYPNTPSTLEFRRIARKLVSVD